MLGSSPVHAIEALRARERQFLGRSPIFTVSLGSNAEIVLRKAGELESLCGNIVRNFVDASAICCGRHCCFQAIPVRKWPWHLLPDLCFGAALGRSLQLRELSIRRLTVEKQSNPNDPPSIRLGK